MFCPDFRIVSLFILGANGGVKLIDTTTTAGFGIIFNVPFKSRDKEEMKIGISFIYFQTGKGSTRGTNGIITSADLLFVLIDAKDTDEKHSSRPHSS